MVIVETLEWSEPISPKSVRGWEVVVAQSLAGTVTIYWKTGNPTKTYHAEWAVTEKLLGDSSHDSLEKAKAQAAADYENFMQYR